MTWQNTGSTTLVPTKSGREGKKKASLSDRTKAGSEIRGLAPNACSDACQLIQVLLTPGDFS